MMGSSDLEMTIDEKQISNISNNESGSNTQVIYLRSLLRKSEQKNMHYEMQIKCLESKLDTLRQFNEQLQFDIFDMKKVREPSDKLCQKLFSEERNLVLTIYLIFSIKIIIPRRIKKLIL